MFASRAALVKRVGASHPRLVRILAPTGYGKATFVRGLAQQFASAGFCDCRDITSLDDLLRHVLAALEHEAGEPSAAAGAGEELARSVRARWSRNPSAKSLFVFEDVDRIVGNAEIARFVRGLLETAPAERTVAITSSGPTPELGACRVAPHEIATISVADLRVTPDDLAASASDESVSTEIRRRITALACGWPIATLLFLRFAREGRLAELLERPDDVAWTDLQSYMASELVGSLGDAERTVLLLCAGAGEVAERDVAMLCAEHDRAALWASLVSFPLVEPVDQGARAHPVLRAALYRFYRDPIRAAVDSAVGRYAELEHRPRAAELLLSSGRRDEAAAMLARGTSGESAPSRETSAVVAKLGPVPLAPYRDLWLAALRHAPHLPREAFDEAQTALASLSPLASAERRAVLATTCGVLARVQARLHDASAFFWNALDALGDGEAGAWLARVIHVEFAVALAMLGRGDEAARRLQLADALPPVPGLRSDELERSLTMIFTHQSRGSWADQAREIRHYATLASQAEEGACESYAYRLAVSHGFFAADHAFEQWGAHRLAERRAGDALYQVTYRAYQSGRGFEALPPPIALFLHVRRILTEECDAPELRRRFEAAEHAAAEIDQTVPCLMLALIGARLPGFDDRTQMQRAINYAREIEGEAFESAVLAYGAGEGPLGPLAGLARRIAETPWSRVSDGVSVEILSGTVRRAGTPVDLTSRSFELIVALALARTALSRDALADRLWPELDGMGAGNALKSCVHRTRLQLGDPGIIVYGKNTYSLNANVRCDVIEIEERFRALEAQRMPTEEFCADLRALGAASPAALPALCEQWEWFQPHGVRIAQLLHSTSMCLANVLIERGRFAEAIDIANALLELDPCDEPAAATAVEAWLRLGNRNQATAACRRYEHALKSSYGDDTSALNLRKMLTSA